MNVEFNWNLKSLWTTTYFFYPIEKNDKQLTLRQSYTCTTISECLQSYGENCQHPCSEHCINQTCDRFNGTCLLGRRGTERGDSLVFL